MYQFTKEKIMQAILDRVTKVDLTEKKKKKQPKFQ